MQTQNGSPGSAGVPPASPRIYPRPLASPQSDEGGSAVKGALMKTRIGKIAQLPKTIREELNRRLEDGQQGPELLPWLNELPVTKNLLNKQFGGKPISKFNLSDWRHGGYHDWLRLQAREERIQRVAEQGDALQHREGKVDLYECFSRMVIADLALDLELLSDLPDKNERWKRLRELSQELTRLQNGYNRSRRTELAWEKWNRNNRLQDEASDTGQTEEEPQNTNAEENIQPRAVAAPIRLRESKYRTIYFTSCRCICRKCHPADSEYPYWQAERDRAESRMTTRAWIEREHEDVHVYEWHCDCTCNGCDIRHADWANQTGAVVPSRTESRRTIHRIIYSTKCHCSSICVKCHPPDGEYPAAQAAADTVALRAHGGRFIRQDKSVSISLRGSLCQCICNQCASEGRIQFSMVQSPTPGTAKISIAQNQIHSPAEHSPAIPPPLENITNG